jgi:hypothetical protein
MEGESTLELYRECCRAIVHMAEQIKGVHETLADLPLEEREAGALLDGAYHVANGLGDILNGMDAVYDEDEWVNPILRRVANWKRARNVEGIDPEYYM